ncbi:MAG: hypothetical protein WBB01_21345 [Phormidesmis sp.]
MAQLYYRGMAEKNGKPKLGRSARLLGIRPGVDIDVTYMPQSRLAKEEGLYPDLEEDSGELLEVVIRNLKGMSTSLSIEGLPPFRKPAAFGGIGKDPLWKIDSDCITGDLEAVQDSATHVSIMPRVTMLLNRYEAALAATQDYWEEVNRDGMDI